MTAIHYWDWRGAKMPACGLVDFMIVCGNPARVTCKNCLRVMRARKG